jgi:hypothetical protein
MKFIAQRLKVIGAAFLFSSILGWPAICFLTQWYVDANLRPFGLTLLGWDSCFFGLSFAVLFVLAATGFVSLLFAFLLMCINKLRLGYPG